MKKISIAAGIMAASLLFCSCNQNASNAKEEGEQGEKTEIAKGSIVYFNLDKVLEEYDMANDLRSEVEAKVAAIQKDVDRRQKNLENAINDFTNKMQKGLMTSATAEAQQKKLQQQDANFRQFAQEKQNEIMEEQQVMMNQIADAIQTYIQDYNAEKGFAMILSNQASVPVIAADPSLDITDDIISGLNAEYVKTKNSRK